MNDATKAETETDLVDTCRAYAQLADNWPTYLALFDHYLATAPEEEVGGDS